MPAPWHPHNYIMRSWPKKNLHIESPPQTKFYIFMLHAPQAPCAAGALRRRRLWRILAPQAPSAHNGTNRQIFKNIETKKSMDLQYIPYLFILLSLNFCPKSGKLKNFLAIEKAMDLQYVLHFLWYHSISDISVQSQSKKYNCMKTI